jgi:hypothetical protein
MLRIRYSANEDVDLEGTREELRSLRDSILRLVAESSGEALSIEADRRFDPSPFDTVVKEMRVLIAPVDCISVECECLTISGRPEFLSDIADSLPWDAVHPRSGIGYHVHYDRWCCELNADDRSLGLILGLRKEDV